MLITPARSVKQAFSPLDEQLKAHGGWSEALVEMALWASQAASSYREAEEMLERLAGISVSKSTLHRMVETYGGEVAQRQEEEARDLWESEAQGEKISPPRQEPKKHLGIALDGVMVWVEDGWHEVKVGSCFEFGPNQVGEVAAHSVGYLGWYGEEVDTFRRTLWGYAYHHGLGLSGKAVVLGDGATWIDGFATTYCPGGVRIVDWYHAMEHVWALGREAYGEEAGTWVKKVEEKLWKGDIPGVIRECREVLGKKEGWSSGVGRTAEYFEQRQEHMRYPEYRAAGYPIGSGVVESACKGIAWRCKNRGQRWKEKGLRAILALRGAGMSGSTGWNEVWNEIRQAA